MHNLRFLLALGAATLFACGGPKSHQVDTKPTAAFKVTQSTVRPQVFSFDASTSSTTVGTIAKYQWLFGDEASGAMPASVTATTTQHVYKMTGTFTVTLVVVDDKDLASDPVTQMVTVASVNTAGPMAVVTGPSTGMSAQMLTFDGSGSMPSGDIQNYAWDFGDGSSVMGKDKTIVQHAFAADGQYTLTLTVTDSLGTSDAAQLHVAIGDVGPLAICTFMPTMPSQGQAVMFDGSQSTVPTGSTITAYVWDFGDGVMNVPGKTVSHTYNGAGPFMPKLTVYDDHMPTHRTNTATCPTVTLGAPSLCVGTYNWHATMDPGCGWSGSTVDVNQMAGGAITLTEPFTPPIVYTGTWTGSTFSVMGSYDQGGVTYDITISGTFSGCTTWTGSYDTNVFGIDCVTQVAATAQ
jgi:PKD repeat protein